jgi:hypothetical protein
MSRYIAGYYGKDEKAAKDLSNTKARKILDALETLYPWGATIPEIAKEAKLSDNTVYNYLQNELLTFSMQEEERKKSKSGEYLAGRGPGRYNIENYSFTLIKNRGFAGQLSRGCVNYNPDFIEVWNLVVEKVRIEEIHSLLVKLLVSIFSKMDSLSFDRKIKDLRPRLESRKRGGERKDMICSHCGINHEARDFIRAILLHLIDGLETNDEYIKFLLGKKFLKEGYNLYKEIPKEPIPEIKDSRLLKNRVRSERIREPHIFSKGRIPKILFFNGKRYKDIKKWVDIPQGLLEAIYESSRSEYESVIKQFPHHISKSKELFDSPRPLPNDYWLRSKLSANRMAGFCNDIMQYAGLSISDWWVEY